MDTLMKFFSAMFFLPCLLATKGVFSQQPSVKKDSAFIFSLLDKAEAFYIVSAYDSALFYTAKAETISRQANYKQGVAYALIKSTEVLLDKEEFETATGNANTVNAIGLQINDSLIAAIGWMQMAQAKMYDNNFTEATELFIKCLQFYFDKNPSRYSALAFNDLGYTWGRLGELGKQANCITRSISIYENYFPDEYGELGVAYNNLSTVYYNLNDRQKAIEYAKKSVAYREKDGDIKRLSLGCCNLSQFYIGVDNEEAKKYQQLCVKYALQSKDEGRIIHSYITASLISSTQKNYKESVEYELKAITLLEKANKDFSMLSRRYMSVASSYASLQKDSSQVLEYYNKAVALSNQVNDKFNLRDVYLKLSNYYRQQQQYDKALEAYQKHVAYRDSLVNQSTKTAIAGIAAKYEGEKKDKAIALLSNEQKIKQLQIEKQKAVIAGNLLEADKKEKEIELLSSARELQDLKIQQQDEQLEKQLLVAKTNEQQLQLAEKEKLLKEKQLKGSEQLRNFLLVGFVLLLLLGYFMFNRYQLQRKIKEQQALLSVRNNIAQDLHDEIGSALTSIKILSQVSKTNLQKDQQKASSFLEKITEQSTEMQQGLSDIVWAIKPDNDKFSDMVARMREYVAHTLEPKNIETVFYIDEQLLNKSLGMQQRRDFFLVFKEAINNAAKYSNCTKVEIKLLPEGNNIQLQIADDGIGFEINTTKASNGLKNMRARAAALGGRLSIQSIIGGGTNLQMNIPAT
jgi:two-component system, NarL family, sensor histidine kinase UhpB